MIVEFDKRIKRARRDGSDMNSASWGYEEGFLLSFNDMQRILEHIVDLRAACRSFINQTTPEFAVANGFLNARNQAKKALNKATITVCYNQKRFELLSTETDLSGKTICKLLNLKTGEIEFVSIEQLNLK